MNFEDFWMKYPRKVAKKMAMKAFEKLPLDEQKLAIDALDTHTLYWKLKKTDTEFIPHPATWLNQARYFDEIKLPSSQSKKTEHQIRQDAIAKAIFGDSSIIEVYDANNTRLLG